MHDVSDMSYLQQLVSDVLHLFYPHLCTGCGSDNLSTDQMLCLPCLLSLPHTRFANLPGNDIERIFTGRIPVVAAHSECFFSKGQLIQHLIHQLKYKSNPSIGIYLGEIMGRTLLDSGRFQDIDYIIPMPLFPDKEFKRGYNQAAVIGQGISTIVQVPQPIGWVIRERATETQTKKHRTERWQNVKDSFRVTNPAAISGKHVLLVDDVVTTGASLEALASAVLACPGTRISIACLAHADK